MLNPNRESIVETANPLGLDGIEFVEFSTTKPQALGQVLQMMGFVPAARHRSREVILYKSGAIHIIVNAHDATSDKPVLSAVAFRVRDAASAFARVVNLGAWAVPTQVEVMELNIPAIHGPGASRLYFVDRYKEFSIYDVDFVPLHGLAASPQSCESPNLSLFGVVQYIGVGRADDWVTFFGELFGFVPKAHSSELGILPKGQVLRSPCNGFYWQLIEPEADVLDASDDERLERMAFGCADVPGAVRALRAGGVEFVDFGAVRSAEKGAITRSYLGSVMFELVRHDGI